MLLQLDKVSQRVHLFFHSIQSDELVKLLIGVAFEGLADDDAVTAVAVVEWLVGIRLRRLSLGVLGIGVAVLAIVGNLDDNGEYAHNDEG